MAKVKKYLPGAESLGTSFGDKAGAFMGKYGGAISSAAGALAPLLMKKPDPNAKPYKKGTKLLKYGEGSKGLLNSESTFRQGLDYGLTGASFIPAVGYAANLVGSGLDLYDAYNAKTPEDRSVALASAGMGLIPGGRIARAALRATKATKTLAKVAPKVANSVDPSYVNKLVNNKTIKEFRNPEQISNAAKKAAESAKGTFSSLWDKTKGMLSGNSIQPSFKKGTNKININMKSNKSLIKYEDGTKKISRYSKLDTKLGGILPGGVTRAEAKAAKASKKVTPTTNVGPMSDGYKIFPKASTGIGPLASGLVTPSVDAGAPAGPMTDIKTYMDPNNIPRKKESNTPSKVKFKKSNNERAPLGGGYKYYDEMNVDQKRQYREGMASGKDFTVTVGDKQLKYKAANSNQKALSEKRNKEWDVKYRNEQKGKYPTMKTNDKEHTEKYIDDILGRINKERGERLGNVNTTNPKKEEDGNGLGGLFAGLASAGGLGLGYHLLKKRLKRKAPIAGAALEAVDEYVPQIVKKSKNVTESSLKKAQQIFNSLNQKALPAAPQRKLLGSGK